MEQKIIFQNSKGQKLVGILSNPGTTENPIILIVPGYSSQKNTKFILKIIPALEKENIATFRIDPYGHGESEGDIEEITISEVVDDIFQAINYLKSKGYKKIGLVGSSFGGTASIMVASKSKELFVLALKCPVSNFEERDAEKYGEKGIKEWKEKGYVIMDQKSGSFKRKWKFFEDSKNNNGYEAAEKIKIPTLIVHGDADDVVSVEQSKKTAKIIENCKLEIIEGAGHDFGTPEQFEKMTSLIADFLIANTNKN